MADLIYTGSVVMQAANLSKTFTASVLKVSVANKSFTATIDPQGTGEVAQGVSEIPDSGITLDVDNLDGLNGI